MATPLPDDRAQRLSQWLSERRARAERNAIPAAPPGPVPLSPGQKRLWFLEELVPGSAAYNVPVAVVARAGVERRPFEAALAGLLERQRALRSRITLVEGTPLQEEIPDLVVPVQWLDAASHDEAMAAAASFGQSPFDLARGPLVRAAVWSTPRGSLVCLVAHHLVIDAWSSSVVIAELAELYRAACEERAPALAPLPVQYRDVAAWQEQQFAAGALDHEVAWWRDRLAGAPATLDLPPDRRPGTPRRWRSGRVLAVLPKEELDALRRLGAARGATLFSVLLAGFNATVVRLGGAEDVAVGSPVAGRLRPEWEGLVGFFVNTVVLRTDCSGDPPFAELLDRVAAGVLEAVAHQEVPFERLVAELAPERDLSHNPLFQAMLTLQNAPAQPVDWGGAWLEGADVELGAARFDLEMVTWVDADDGLVVRAEFDLDVFEPATIERFVERFRRILAAAAADPGGPLSALDGMAPGERAAVLAAGAGRAGSGGEAPVPALVEAAARARPGAPAVVGADGSVLDYAGLWSRAAGLAARLAEEGAGPESVVGVCAERSADLVVAWLAVWLAGGAYLPLDPGYPDARLALMAADCGARLAVAAPGLEGRVPPGLAVVGARESAAGPPPPAGPACPDRLAYVVYTSGSTGRPKGIGVTHRGVGRLVAGPDYAPLGPSDVVAFASSPSFDAATFEVWGALAAGAALAVVPPETLLAPDRLRALLAERRVSAAFVTTALFNQLAVHDPSLFAGVGRVLFGGEAADPGAVAAVLGAGGPGRLVHVYGPTETTTFATWLEVGAVEPGARTVPIGGPIADTTARVLDRRGALAPPGGAGELHVGGAGLARGYVGRPGLTAERFVPDPFGPPGSRAYRTGDRVRLRADGRLEFLGRGDGQVKVRGFRIEPAEVEAALLALPGVAEAAAGAPGGRLTAWAAPRPGAALDGPSLRAALRASLPAYMVPAAVVVLDRLPLNANGKVDRAALPAPAPGLGLAGGGGGGAPRGGVEAALAGVWAEVLGLPSVGVHDNFFDLGGDSISSLVLVARAAEAGLAFTITDVFARQTVAELATVAKVTEAVGGGHEAAAVSLTAAQQRWVEEQDDGDVEAVLPLTPLQEGMVFHTLEDPSAGAYHEHVELLLTGSVDVEAMAEAWRVVVGRQATCRTGFAWEGLDQPVQVVFRDPGADIDLDTSSDVAAWRTGLQAHRFDLARPPLRLSILRAGDDRVHVNLSFHHALLDGWSIPVLLDELFTAYRGEPLPPVEPAAWPGPVHDAESERHWRRVVAGLDGPSRLLPSSAASSAASTAAEPGRAEARRWDVHIPAAVADGLAEAARRNRVTLSTAVHGVTALLLGPLSGTGEAVFGSVVSGRSHDLADVERRVGSFLNTLPFRAPAGGGQTVAEWLADLQERLVLQQVHGRTPLARIQEWAGLAPGERLFDVLFAFENTPVREADPVAGLRVEVQPGGPARTAYPLAITVVPHDGLHVAFHYDPARLTDEDVARMGRRFAHLVEALAAAAADPGGPLSALGGMAPGERAAVLAAGTGRAGSGGEAPVPALVEAAARARPGAPAVVGADGSVLDYAGLWSRAAGLAARLAEEGAGPESVVGVCAERSADLVVAWLAVWLAGGAYLPLDPGYPDARLALMAADCGARLAVAAPGLEGRVPPGLAVVGARESAAGPPPPAGPACPDRLAYVVYTSGSTGRPKGIGVTHRGVGRLVAGPDYAPLGPSDVVAFASSPSFDAATFEVWGALAAGAALAVVPPETLLAPDRLRALLAERRVSAAFVTTALFNQLAVHDPSLFAGVGRVLFGGEAADPGAVAAVLGAGGPGRLVHVYGPTETTTFATWLEVGAVEPGARTVPIGGPIADTTARVLDRRGALAPPGGAGELHVGGAGLARGYVGRPGLTAERFVPDPFGPPGSRAYRTGDRVRLRADGRLEFLGRGDGQVKVRGFRIEPAEVEAALLALPGVAEAAAGAPGGRLTAWAAPRPGAALDGPSLRAALRASLPAYMVPAAVVVLDRLPLNANGKVDRAALPAPAPGLGLAGGGGGGAPRGGVEAALAGVWAEVLGLPSVGVHDNFFDLGGDSIRVINVVDLARQRGLRIRPGAVFRHPTVAELAAHGVDAEGEARPAEAPMVGRVSPTPVQQWFFDLPLADRHHFNQSVLVELAPPVDFVALAGAVRAVVAHHDALRTTARRGAEGWVLDVPAVPAVPADVEHDVFARVDALDPAAVAAAQAGLDLARGPLFRAVADSADRLLLVAHHLVVDSVSWSVVMADLDTAYRQLRAGEAVRLPERTTSVDQWATRLRQAAASGRFDGEAEFWRSQAVGAAALALDERGDATVAAERQVTVAWSEATTTALIRQLPQERHVRPDAVLLAATAAALTGWSSAPRLLVRFEGHGREDLFDGVDLSRTVGWLTALLPLGLDRPPADPAAAVAAARQLLDGIPSGGVGFATRHTLTALPEPEISYNFLGVLPTSTSALVAGPAPEGVAAQFAPTTVRPHALDIALAVAGGTLRAVLTHDKRLAVDRVDDLAARLRREVERLVGSLSAAGASPRRLAQQSARRRQARR
jgi:amino acid adenylation domain-containing protein